MPPRSVQKKTLIPKLPTRSSTRSPKPPVKPAESETDPKNELDVDSSGENASNVEQDIVKSDLSEAITVENGEETKVSESTVNVERSEIVVEEVADGVTTVVTKVVEVKEEVTVEVKGEEEEVKGDKSVEGDEGSAGGGEEDADEDEGGADGEEEVVAEGEEEGEGEEGEGEEEEEGEGEEEEEGEEEVGGEQENIHEVPKPVEERRKQKEYEIFVGGVDKDAVEEDLKKVFEAVGEVVEVRLAKKQGSQKNKGFAFVRFATVEQAKKAATELKYPQVKGKVCGVTRNNDNETLHLGNICKTWTKDDLAGKLKAFELENLEDVHLIDDPSNKGMNRGYAFLEFSTHNDAVSACTKLQKGNVFFGTDVRAEVAFAKSAFEPDEEIMAQVKSVFLDGLPATWDEARVIDRFKRFGEIEKVQLASSMRTAKRKDFGFVSFVTREAALDCIEEVNKNGIGEGEEKVSVKATLRKPIQKRKPIMMAGWRGSIGRGRGGRGLPRGRGVVYSYPSRGMGRGRGGRPGGPVRYSSRGSEFRRGPPYMGKYGAGPVREFERPAVQRRSRGSYLESRYYEDYPASYSRNPSRGLYPEESYDPRFMEYENPVPVTREYRTVPKRPFSSLDDDLLSSRPLTRRARASDLEMGGAVSAYDGYSRTVPDDLYGYERPSYASQSFGSRYLSGSGAPRSYY